MRTLAWVFSTLLSVLVNVHSSNAAAILNLSDDYLRVTVSAAAYSPTDPRYEYNSSIYVGGAYSEVNYSRQLEVGAGPPTEYTYPGPQITAYAFWQGQQGIDSYYFGTFLYSGNDREVTPSLGYASMELAWRFSVEGDGASLRLSNAANMWYTAGGYSIYDDTLGTVLTRYGAEPEIGGYGDTINLVDGHQYRLTEYLLIECLSGDPGANFDMSLNSAKIVKVPEPSTVLLLGSGLMGLLGCGRKRIKK